VEVIGNPKEEQVSTSSVERQSQQANADAPIDAFDECVHQKAGQSHRDDCAVSHVP
jgi:hypothetical protein